MMKIAVPLHGEENRVTLNRPYIQYIIAAGYLPVLLPAPCSKEESDLLIEYAESECVGLLLPGGIDIDPIYYGETNTLSKSTDPAKDSFERGLLHKFISSSKPVFGICRGFQLIVREFLLLQTPVSAISEWNMKFLRFEQNIEGHHDPNRLQVGRNQATVYVSARMNLLYENQPSETISRIPVNSIHHQALLCTPPEGKTMADFTCPGLRFSAWQLYGSDSSPSYVIEGADFTDFFDGGIVSGVQWHPEELGDTALLHKVYNSGKNPSKSEAKSYISAIGAGPAV